VIDGAAGANFLLGGASNDTLLGIGNLNESPHVDTLLSSTGKDLLRGGNDVYHFNVGDSVDVINDEYFFTGQSPMGPGRLSLALANP
jgi:Ca2+-binding RTX toxin-like protein